MFLIIKCNTITGMCWSFDDNTLVSCGTDGTVYEWDVSNKGKRVHELVIKSCEYNDATLESRYDEKDNNHLICYAVGSDKTIKQIGKSSLLREIDLHTISLSSIALSYDCKMLFSGSTTGTVQVKIILLKGELIEVSSPLKIFRIL